MCPLESLPFIDIYSGPNRVHCGRCIGRLEQLVEKIKQRKPQVVCLAVNSLPLQNGIFVFTGCFFLELNHDASMLGNGKNAMPSGRTV